MTWTSMFRLFWGYCWIEKEASPIRGWCDASRRLLRMARRGGDNDDEDFILKQQQLDMTWTLFSLLFLFSLSRLWIAVTAHVGSSNVSRMKWLSEARKKERGTLIGILREPWCYDVQLRPRSYRHCTASNTLGKSSTRREDRRFCPQLLSLSSVSLLFQKRDLKNDENKREKLVVPARCLCFSFGISYSTTVFVPATTHAQCTYFLFFLS